MEETQKFSLNLPRLPVKRGFSWCRPQALGELAVTRSTSALAGDTCYAKPRGEAGVRNSLRTRRS